MKFIITWISGTKPYIFISGKSNFEILYAQTYEHLRKFNKSNRSLHAKLRNDWTKIFVPLILFDISLQKSRGKTYWKCVQKVSRLKSCQMSHRAQRRGWHVTATSDVFRALSFASVVRGERLKSECFCHVSLSNTVREDRTVRVRWILPGRKDGDRNSTTHADCILRWNSVQTGRLKRDECRTKVTSVLSALPAVQRYTGRWSAWCSAEWQICYSRNGWRARNFLWLVSGHLN
jgi:hypothetical protein